MPLKFVLFQQYDTPPNYEKSWGNTKMDYSSRSACDIVIIYCVGFLFNKFQILNTVKTHFECNIK